MKSICSMREEMKLLTASPRALCLSIGGLAFSAFGLAGCDDSAGSHDGNQARAQTCTGAGR
jgi:hypothetical protein